MQRIATLDGWRGLAILLVLADHFMPYRTGIPVAPWLCDGAHGVTIFFVLSGYLITTRLRQEHESNGRVDLRGFYRRRVRRLMPCAWAYLLYIWSALSLKEFLSCIFFFRNYIRVPSEATWHFWSLSLEEQFYLLWPAILLALGMRRARWVALLGAMAVALYRFTHWHAYFNLSHCFRSEVRADALLVGCLAALIAERLPRTHVAWHALALALVLFATTRYTELIPLWESCLIAYLMVESLRNAWGRLLTPLAGLGLISYSVYVWQQAFALMVRHDAARLFYALLLVPAVWVSFTFLERPFMKPAQPGAALLPQTEPFPEPV